MFGWGWTEYGDVFRKGVRSRSEFCFEVVIAGAVDQPPTADIKPPFEFVSCGRHVGTEDECYRQPGQEIPILRLPKCTEPVSANVVCLETSRAFDGIGVEPECRRGIFAR
jgi:hypothetical protein